MQFFIVLVVYSFIIIFDYLPIIKRNNKPLSIVYGSMVCVSFVVLTLYCFNLSKPVISDFIIRTVKTLFHIS